MTSYIPHPETGLYLPDHTAAFDQSREDIEMNPETGHPLPDYPPAEWGQVPVRQTLAEDQADEEAGGPAGVDDAAVWPVERGRKGKTVRDGRPDPAAVAMATRRAEQMQDVDLELLSSTPDHDEIAAVVARGRTHRADWRDLEDREHADRIAQADRQREHQAQIAERRRQFDNEVADARERQFRATDPTQQLRRLAWAEKWLPAAGLVPAAFAVAAGAVNVFTELTRINPGTAWINWSVEPLFTLPLLIILAAQMLGALPKPDLAGGVRSALRTNRYAGMEIGLTGVAILLNVVPHWLPAGHWSGDLVWLVVPAGLGFSAYLVPKLVTDIRQALAEWTGPGDPVPASGESSRAEPVPTPADLHEYSRTEGCGEIGAAALEPIREPDRRSADEAYSALAEAVESGAVDPQTGRAVDPNSAESIRRTIGVGRTRATELRDSWKQTA